MWWALVGAKSAHTADHQSLDKEICKDESANVKTQAAAVWEGWEQISTSPNSHHGTE